MLQSDPMHAHQTTHLQIIVSWCQHLNDTDAHIAQVRDKVWQPLLDVVEATENLRIAISINGHILDYLARQNDSMLPRMKVLCKQGRIEILGGFFYGASPALLTEIDIRGQVQMLSEYWESYTGFIPKGFFLPHLQWPVELTSLLSDTDLHYGFLPRTQLALTPGFDALAVRAADMGMLEHAGQRLTAFVLDNDLSAAINQTPLNAWVAAIGDASKKTQHRLISTVTQVRNATSVLLPTWLQELAAQSEIETVLPADMFATLRPIGRLHLIAPDEPTFDKVRLQPVYQRLLRASQRLHEAVYMMEDEGLEKNWSDKLATAQRAIFSAQHTDLSHIDTTVASLPIRRAIVQRIQRAETMMDTLLYNQHDTNNAWLFVEENDLDGDLLEEIFVGTPHLLAWLVPSAGGAINMLDLRHIECNVIEGGNASGVRHWLRYANQQLVSYQDLPLSDDLSASFKWDVVHQAIKDDQSEYHVLLKTDKTNQHVSAEYKITLLQQTATCCLDLTLASNNQENYVWLLEIPICLGDDRHVLYANNGICSGNALLENIDHLKIETVLSSVQINLSNKINIRVAENAAAPSGFVLLLMQPFQDKTNLSLTLSFYTNT